MQAAEFREAKEGATQETTAVAERFANTAYARGMPRTRRGGGGGAGGGEDKALFVYRDSGVGELVTK